MKLIAKKPCSFRGEKFYIGNEIPAEYVLDAKEQEKMGVLAIVEDTKAPADSTEDDKTPVEVVCVSVTVEEGILPLEITPAGLQEVVNVLTSKAPEAKEIIEQMTDGDALYLLHMTDSRSTIKQAAEARAKALNAEDEEEGDQ